MSKAIVLQSNETAQASKPEQAARPEPAARPEANGIEISDGKRQQMYRESLSAFSQGVMFGWKEDLYKAFSLYNIQQNKLYELDCVDWAGFVEKLQISERSVQRYMKIAQRVREMIKASGETNLLPTYITQKDFNGAFEPFFTNGKQLTLRGLVSASGDLETFRGYLSGEQIEDKAVIKLLNKKNAKTPEQKEREEREAKIASEMEAEQSTFYRSEAAARNYVWDNDENTYRNADGTPLSDKQQSEFITAVDALKVWSRSEQVLADAKSEIERAAKAYGATFHSYRRHATDNSFQAKATEKFRTTIMLIEQIDHILRHIHVGEEAVA